MSQNAQRSKTGLALFAAALLLGTIFLSIKKSSLSLTDTQPALVIATISDLHGQLEPGYAWAKDGTLREMGGISRIATALEKLKKQYPDKVLLLGSGDYFTEDFRVGKYFKTFGGRAIAYFLNALPLDASTIGNHEFDFGLKSADEALHKCSFPIVATNLKNADLSVPIAKKLVLHKNGYKVGILGLLSPALMGYGFFRDAPQTKKLPLLFEPDLYKCTQIAVNNLKNLDHVDFVIVLSHLGIEEDRRLAQVVNGIDVICGGHTHITTKRGGEVVVNQQKHRTVIVHPGYKGIHLGVIKLWRKKADFLKHEWDVIEIDSSIAKNQLLEEKLEQLRKQLPGSTVITTTTCPIDATKLGLRTQENGFANFVAQVIRNYFAADIP